MQMNHIIQAKTLIDLLRHRAENQANKTAYTFLVDGENEEVSLTYEQLDQRVRTIAAKLHDRVVIGDRALLLYPPGLDYIAAFFACLYAGIIAVPTYPPRRKRIDPRILAIVADAQASVVLTTNSIFSDMEQRIAHVPELKNLHWLATDNLIDDQASVWQKPAIHKDTLAFLQYTSGSTGTPKGVMVSHGNLLHNEEMIKQGFGYTEKDISVGWLPLFHDMGLIGNILQPLYLGIPCILMSPVAFLQKPYRWLQAISYYNASISGGPNFAYDLCINKITAEQRAKLDLSHWEVAFSGAEPISVETLNRFTTIFEPCGFKREAFSPCYGMAEATLFISGSLKNSLYKICKVEKAALEVNVVYLDKEDTEAIVGCGQTCLEQKIVIVNPATFYSCQEQEVGEIWVFGQSVTQGYWNKPTETEQTFHAYIADTNEGPFLRTGDLGFLQDGELFVTGRLKDLIIIRGRNHYPQDIERTVEQSHPRLLSGNSAAFSVEINGEERLVVAAEVERRYGPHDNRRSGLERRSISKPISDSERRSGLDRRSGSEHRQVAPVSSLKSKFPKDFNVEETINSIRKAVYEQHELAVYAVLLLRVASIPKTTSGKIQRHACKNGFLIGSGLNIVGEWREDLVADSTSENLVSKEEIKQKLDQASTKEYDQILTNFLQTELASVLKLKTSQIDIQQPLNIMGLDSLKTVELINMLRNKLDVYIPLEKMMDGISIIELVTHIKSKIQASDSSIEWEEIEL